MFDYFWFSKISKSPENSKKNYSFVCVGGDGVFGGGSTKLFANVKGFVQLRGFAPEIAQNRSYILGFLSININLIN